MLAKLGFTETIMIVAVLLVLLGPSHLPKLGQALGKRLKEFLSRLL